MPDAMTAMTTSRGPGAGSGNSASASLRPPRNVTPRMAGGGLFRCRLFEGVLHCGERLELDGPWLAVHHLHLADVDVLNDVAGVRVDLDGTARAFPFHAFERGQHRVGVGIAIGLFQRAIDRGHAV